MVYIFTNSDKDPIERFKVQITPAELIEVLRKIV